jgi:osmotically-inducible protein OsmY
MPTSDIVVLSRAKERDHSLDQQVNQTLRETGYAGLQRVRCRVQDGIIELSGDVPSFYFKQLAQELLLALKHVQGVENHLSVRCSG